MNNVFISHGNDAKPRWREAFDRALIVPPEAASHRVKPGDIAWVMANLEDWPVLVSRLQAKGASLVVMSYVPTSLEAFQALDSGARGYVHALSPSQLLREVALVISHHGIWIPTELMARVVGSTYRALGGEERLQDDTLALLTERERAVALAVAKGQSNKEVARSLAITERTVKAHLGAVFRKLGIRDRMQLILRLSNAQEVTIPSQ
ncbi:LuxR family transcriptional regulator [Halomonas urumqiensis]|uniref:DNA-binding response regulator n=1 Tax=Halomonas urumqiensis TaxID=1684789 RepID=A0A2N7UGS2_9GAMM|nr:response regulator transcription factor [Halomonas urumqiensis]PMR79614.1 DNA-binding response regulator [Halomonas urumqiensis]PTB01064.1 DNA-binding response regulator [Halomonas urumqiensis]GHE22861.1 hypothetical protein GCM10017767_33820 [Halomonas urumqiensis]